MTPTETMPALLRRWAELEPERLQRSQSGYFLPHVPFVGCEMDGRRVAWISDQMDQVDHAVLQYAVQQACLTDGLYASLEIDDDTSLCLEDPASDGRIGGSAALEGCSTDTLVCVWLMARIAYLESRRRALTTA